jgi:hypothetical protein
MTNRTLPFLFLLLTAQYVSAARYGYVTNIISNPLIPKFEIHAGCAVPTGLFGSQSEMVGYTHGAGHAGKGVIIGGKFMYPWQDRALPYRSVRGLFTVVGIDLLYNPLNMDFYELEMPYILPDGTSANLKPARFGYLNIPVFIGLGGEVSINPHVALYGEIGAGATASRITNSEVNFQYSENGTYTTLQHHFTIDLSFVVEGSIVLNDLVTVGIKYNHLSKRTHKYTLAESIRNENGSVTEQKIDDRYPRSLPMTTISVCIGVRLYYRDCYPCLKN